MDSTHSNSNIKDKFEKESKILNKKIETVYGMVVTDYYAPGLKAISDKSKRLDKVKEEINKLDDEINKMKQDLVKILDYPIDDIKILFKSIGLFLKQAKSYEIRKNCEINILLKKQRLSLLEKNKLKILNEFNQGKQEIVKLRKLFDTNLNLLNTESTSDEKQDL